MNVPRTLIVTSALVAFAVLSLHTTGPAAVAQSATESEYRQPQLISVTFDGGTVQQYINAIRKQDANLNVILDFDDLQIPMPKVELKSVELTSAMEVLDHRIATIDGQFAQLDVNMIRTSPRDNPVFVITAETRAIGRAGPNRSAVITVKDVINAGLTPSDVLTAVETALDLFGDDSSGAEMRFHEETGLLIARGSAEQMATIHSVLEQLRESVHQTMRDNAQEQERAEIEHAFARMQDEVESHRHEMQLAARKLAESQTRNEVLERELDRARAALQEHQMRVLDLSTRIEQMKMEIMHLHQQRSGTEGKP